MVFWDDLLRAFGYAWPIFLISAVLSIAFTLDPVHEALVALAKNIGRGPNGTTSAILTIGLFFFIPAILYSTTKIAIETKYYPGRPPEKPEHTLSETLILTWVGRLPLIAVPFAIWQILTPTDGTVPPSGWEKGYLLVMAAYAAFAALTGIGVFLGTARRKSLLNRLKRFPPFRWLYRAYELTRDFCMRTHWTIGVIAAALFAAFTLKPEIATFIGPIGTTLVFVAVAAFALAGLIRGSRSLSYRHLPLLIIVAALIVGASSRTGTMILAGLAVVLLIAIFLWPGGATGPQKAVGAGVAAVAVLMLGLTFLRPDCQTLSGCNIVAGTELTSKAMNVGDAFDDWRRARPQHGDRPALPPVRLVAAQGGGLFTAYQTALYLAKRSDVEGAGFARSIFAISGVSGGSVGAAVYWQILRSGICDRPDAAPDCHQQTARAILAQDYLSPLLAGLFTRDLIDTILPVSAMKQDWRIDRGRMLEQLLVGRADAATGTADGSGLETGLVASWSPEAGLPALFLNATHVQTGNRAIMSPFAEIISAELSASLSPGEGRDLSVVSAAVMSARFPLVTPPARIIRKGETPQDSETMQIVDGGYYDNSGLETIYDIVGRIHQQQGDRIEVLMLNVDERPCWQDPDPDPNTTCEREKPSLPGTFAAPLKAFAAAWTSRRELSRSRLQEGWGDAIALHPVPVRARQLNFTVSWYLDRGTFCMIEQELNRDLIAAGQGGKRLTLPEECKPVELAVAESAAETRGKEGTGSEPLSVPLPVQ